MRSSRSSRLGVGALVAAGALLVGTAAPSGAAPPPKYQLTVTDTFLPDGGIEFSVQVVPDVVAPGVYKVGFANNSVAPHVLVTVGGLPEDIDTVEEFIALIEAVESGTPPPEGAFEVGAIFVKPGQDHQKQFDLTAEGRYGYFCPIPSPDGTPHYREGFVGLFDVA
jgi:hypothetical protein